jgi:hypothetical protein
MARNKFTRKSFSKKSISNSRLKKSYKKRNNISKRKKNAKIKGGTNDKIECCMCEKKVNKENTLIPVECLMKHGKINSHKICKDCWWDKDTGFAREGTNHRCPGCVKNPIIKPTSEKKTEAIIDLTLDDD